MAMREVINIPHDPSYREYRDILIYLIGNAYTEILARVGEIGAYRFYDIRSAAEEAISRGVDVSICAHDPSKDLVARASSHGVKLYLTDNEPEEKFTVVDKRHVLVSYPKQGRAGTVYLNDKKMAKKYVDKFWKVVRDEKLEPTPYEKIEDSLLTLLR